MRAADLEYERMTSGSHVVARGSLDGPLRTIWPFAGALVGAVTIFGLELSVRVPLYMPLCAPCTEEFVVPNVALLPLFVVLLGGALAVLYARVTYGTVVVADVVRGMTAGLVAALGAGLIVTATLPFSDPYVGTPYRAYALGFVFAVAFALSGWLSRSMRAPSPTAFVALFALPVISALAVAAGSVLPRGGLMVGATALLGMGAGATLSRSRLADAQLRRVRNLRTGPVLATVILVAFVLRVVYGLQALLRLGPGMAFALASDDGPAYYTYAHAIYADPTAAGAVLSNSSGYPPLYAFFLASLFALTRENLAVVVVVQAILASVSTALLYLLARDLAGRVAALSAAALFAMSQNLIQNQATLTPEALLVPTILAALYCAGRYQQEARARWLVATASLLGLAFITRNLIFVLTIGFLLWLLAHKRGTLLSWVRDVAVVLAVTLLAAIPVAVATAQHNGAPRFTNQAAGLGWEYVSDSGITIENAFLTERGINPLRDPIGSALRSVADPLPVLGFLASAIPQRVSALMFFPTIGSSDPLFLVNPAQYPSPFGQIAELLLVVALTVGSLWLLRPAERRRSHMVGLLAAYVLIYIALFAFLFPPRQAYRYRVPITPIVQIAQAVGLVVMTRYAIRAWRSTPAADANGTWRGANAIGSEAGQRS